MSLSIKVHESRKLLVWRFPMTSPLTDGGAASQASQVDATQQSSQEAANSKQPAAANGGGTATSFKSLAELHEKAPEVYNGILTSVGMGMCREQNEANARIKKANREYSS